LKAVLELARAAGVLWRCCSGVAATIRQGERGDNQVERLDIPGGARRHIKVNV
jgi:hypothetical protein